VQQFFLANRYPTPQEVEALYRRLHQDPPDAAEGWTLETLQAALDRPRTKLQVAASMLRRERIAAMDRQGRLRLLRRGLDADTLAALDQAWRDKRAEDRAMLEQMVFYAQTGWCRWKVLLEAFGETPAFDGCGHCDNCVRIEQQRQAAAVTETDAEEETATPQGGTAAPSARAAFVPGDRVQVRRYGRGIVTAADATSVTVEFAGGASRCFQPEYVRQVAAAAARRGRVSAAGAA
jgi:ATP-dependent DNA helicase RecQ